MLDLSPDRQGLIPPLYAQRYKELGDFIRSCYGTSLLPKTHAMSDNSLVHLLTFGTPATIDRSVIQEDQTMGQVIRAYTVDVQLANSTVNDEWVTVAEGTSVGNKKIDLWKSGPLLVKAVLLNITKVVDKPTIKNFSVHLCNES